MTLKSQFGQFGQFKVIPASSLGWKTVLVRPALHYTTTECTAYPCTAIITILSSILCGWRDWWWLVGK